MLNAPCTMHYYIDDEGRRQSNHLLKDCRTFQRMLPVFGRTNQNASRQGFAGAPGSVAFSAPPPPPLPAQNPLMAIQAVPANNSNPPNGYTDSSRVVNMIKKSRPPNRQQKIITRQVNLTMQAPPPMPEYLDWSDQYIGFGREVHPYKILRLGHSPLVLDTQIGGYDCSRVFLDAGSALNLIYAETLRAMNISLNNLMPSDTGFHGIVPGKPKIPLGKIWLDVVFGTRENFRREKLEFEVMDFLSQYHVILGRPAYFRFMAVSHHAYLLLKMLGPNGVITVKENFARSDACNREFHKISQTFGMHAEFLQIQSAVDHEVSPDVRRSLPDQAFDVDKDTKKVQIHPSDSTKMTFVATCLDVTEERALVEFLRER